MVDITRRQRRTVLLIGLAVVVAALAWWALAAASTQSQPGQSQPGQSQPGQSQPGRSQPGQGQAARGGTALDTRTVRAGSVEVRMTPRALDQTGAAFRVEFTTHSGALDLDPAIAARLSVNGSITEGGTWTGPGPGGHHRAGSLRFATPVPPGATVELRITGLPQDAVGTWTVP